MLADKDAEVVDELLAMSPNEPNQIVAKKKATGVPLTIAEACLLVLEYAILITEKGIRSAVPDAGTGSFLVYGALEVSIFTVRCNLGQISDPPFVEQIETRVTEIERSAEAELELVVTTIKRGV